MYVRNYSIYFLGCNIQTYAVYGCVVFFGIPQTGIGFELSNSVAAHPSYTSTVNHREMDGTLRISKTHISADNSATTKP